MYQSITVVGRLGSDVELRTMPSGTEVAKFSLATNRRWKEKASGEWREEVTWFRVDVFGGQAGPCSQYLQKGRQVLVQGRLKPDAETGGPSIWKRSDGTPAASFELVADNVRFLGSGRQDPAPIEVVDEIPF